MVLRSKEKFARQFAAIPKIYQDFRVSGQQTREHAAEHLTPRRNTRHQETGTKTNKSPEYGPERKKTSELEDVDFALDCGTLDCLSFSGQGDGYALGEGSFVAIRHH